mmetsp:Transcript_38211/g.118078  ORF Transcript_38211/g.118078 Transcript_38211/m.118078 type:complete len:207 (+) Transcript_38211:1091-1711(+)
MHFVGPLVPLRKCCGASFSGHGALTGHHFVDEVFAGFVPRAFCPSPPHGLLCVVSAVPFGPVFVDFVVCCCGFGHRGAQCTVRLVLRVGRVLHLTVLLDNDTPGLDVAHELMKLAVGVLLLHRRRGLAVDAVHLHGLIVVVVRPFFALGPRVAELLDPVVHPRRRGAFGMTGLVERGLHLRLGVCSFERSLQSVLLHRLLGTGLEL